MLSFFFAVIVPVAMMQTISSHDAKIGQTFQFQTVAAVKDGNVDIPAGTMGEGIVNDVRSAHFMKGAHLKLEPQVLRLANGTTIPVTFAPDNKLGDNSRPHIFPFPTFFGPIPVAAIVNPAKDVSVPAGTRFSVDAH
jgi:hypothetical protein